MFLQRHNKVITISESFALNLCISVLLRNKKLFALLQYYKLKKNFFLFSGRLIFFSAFNVVPSNPCVGSSPRIKISFFCYQYVQKNSCLLQILYSFYKIHYLLKKFPFYQIQCHVQNTCTFQYHYV